MRYFIEISYKGTAYSGFQAQRNANTIQAEIEKALGIFFKKDFHLTGSSRTDAGVHALQNFFHFDTEQPLIENKISNEFWASKASFQQEDLEKAAYHINAILPRDIVVKRIFTVTDDAHCRFDAISREYRYFIYYNKNPFLEDRAYFLPYKTDLEILKKCAGIIAANRDFTSFSKKNTQVKNFICEIKKSEWLIENGTLVYRVEANRFLRGMVKGLVGTMLKAGRGTISLDEFEQIIESRNCVKADFSVPSYGLFLIKVFYKDF
ncbi:MAG: tRNA pseudouridine(38-40) synthase TruA [Ginsengibacter sp.]